MGFVELMGCLYLLGFALCFWEILFMMETLKAELLRFGFINFSNLEYDGSCSWQVDCYVK